ncbi:uncharacterized protein F4822DRAFT_432874 [Hypoxylon trugodes]|uniref:uncharacterized protein n=1 Tax=Hypoxylon trugodes TaxID=326681 RepID=UPI0021961D52|nr:uncharacterized protein F4822DRAFT_432874 [Hypoxylon trugodes]KAI1386016.1 hypothetical protein F4822DRAFT_432874 [Hypoxylon trugodes]
MTSLYDLTIPAITRVVQTEVTLLKKAEEHAKSIGKSAEEYVKARLAPDMFPLSLQVVVTVIYSQKAIQYLAGGAAPTVEIKEYTLEESYGLLNDTLAALAAVKPESINGKEAETVQFNISKRTTSAPAIEWYDIPFPYMVISIANSFAVLLTRFILPTVYFHVTTLYDILRAEGVPLGKHDFLTHLIEGWELS